MLFNKWSISPVLLSGAILLGSVGDAIAQYGWIELGRQDNLIFQLNPDVTRSKSNNSVVAYELYLTAPQEINGVRSIRMQLLARCNSKQQILSRIERFDDKGLSVGVDDYDVSHSADWSSPKSDLYGKAFYMACNSH